MSGAVPTLGYPSRGIAANALLDQGLTKNVIAERMGITRKQLEAVLYSKPVIPIKPHPKTVAARARRILSASGQGVMLSGEAGRTEHRETRLDTCRIVELRLSDAEYLALITRARTERCTPSSLARQIVCAGLNPEETP